MTTVQRNEITLAVLVQFSRWTVRLSPDSTGFTIAVPVSPASSIKAYHGNFPFQKIAQSHVARLREAALADALRYGLDEHGRIQYPDDALPGSHERLVLHGISFRVFPSTPPIAAMNISPRPKVITYGVNAARIKKSNAVRRAASVHAHAIDQHNSVAKRALFFTLFLVLALSVQALFDIFIRSS